MWQHRIKLFMSIVSQESPECIFQPSVTPFYYSVGLGVVWGGVSNQPATGCTILPFAKIGTVSPDPSEFVLTDKSSKKLSRLGK